MTLLITFGAVAAYITGILAYARIHYRHTEWQAHTTHDEKIVFSILTGLIWPVIVAIIPPIVVIAGFYWGAEKVITFPSRAEALAGRGEAKAKASEELQGRIVDLERELF